MAVPRKPKQVQSRTFGLSVEAIPDVDNLIENDDPEKLQKALERAGLTRLAEQAGPIQKAERAALANVELTSADWERYRALLTELARPETYSGAVPPPEVRVALQLAREAKLFDTIQMLSGQDNTETLVVGVVEGARPRYFLIAQWGTRLTSVEDLHARHDLRSARSSARRWVGLDGGTNQVALEAMVIVLGAVLLPLNLISWWLYMPILVAVMARSGFVVARNTSRWSSRRFNCGMLIAVQLALGIGIGGVKLHTWNTKPRTIEVTVCGVGDRRDIITTSRGNFSLEAGQYNGTYYPAITDTLATSFVGHAMLVTIHGHNLDGYHDGTSGPYVTAATTIGVRQCGSS